MQTDRLTLTRADGSTEEFDPRSVIIPPVSGVLPELAALDRVRRELETLPEPERMRILDWLTAYFVGRAP